VSCAVLPGTATAAGRKAQFSIPAGAPLDRALTQFSAQSDRDILFTPAMVAGRRSKGVWGRMDSDAALETLLRGSGLTWREFQGRYLVEHAGLEKTVIESAAEVEGVVVTALRRPTLDRLTPMSVRAFSGEELTRAGAATFTQAANLLPGLTQTSTGTGRNRFSLRGVSGSGEATTALYYDDIPVTGPSGTTADPGGSSPEFLLVDVDRLELLRGPQGTLYGSSAMGGALKVVFKRPDLSNPSASLAAEVSTNAGEWGQAQTLVLNQPLVQDKVGLRLAVYHRSDPAYLDNRRLGLARVNEGSTSGARLGVGFELEGDLQINLTAAHQDTREGDTSGGWLGAPSNVSYAYVRTPFDSLMTMYEGALVWRVSGVRLSANVASYTWKSTRQIDYTGTLQSERLSLDGCKRYLQISALGTCTPGQLDLYSAYVDSRAPGLLYQPIDLKADVQEVRLQSDTSGFVAWTAGLFREARSDTIDSQVIVADPATGLPRHGDFTGRRIVASRLSQRAVFGEVTLGADRDTSFVLGARHFVYDKLTQGEALIVNVISNTTEANFRNMTGESGWSLKLLASHRFSPTTMGYAQASQGFRPGGVNTVPGLPPNVAAYGADGLWNYELGIKSSWLNNRLTLNAALYHIDWRDMQYTANSTNGAFSFITNLGQARVNGLEADASFVLSPALRGGANLALTDAILTSDQASDVGIGLGASGDHIPAVPRVAADGWVEYRRDLAAGLELMLRADAAYVGRSHSTFDPGVGSDLALGDYWLVNTRAVLRSANWTLSAFVENLTDTDDPSFATTGRQPLTFAPRPRRFGVAATYEF
jgi:iron complex outermembrane receptor protein